MEWIAKLSHAYHGLFVDRRDPRVDAYPLMSSPFPTLLICLTYVYIVKVAGPRFMKDRQPYHFPRLLVVYNLFQVVFSTWLFYEYGRGGWFHGYSFSCQPVDYSEGEMAQRMVRVCWWYYFSKFSEFFDTFFFIARKKYAQASPLHVVHHGIMPMSVWFGVKFTPGGHSTFFSLLNTFVHIFMYLYYASAAIPSNTAHLKFKKHLTSLQMVQFVLIALHSFQLLFIQCNYPKAFVWWIGCHGLLFLVLFSGFYRKEYLEKRKLKKLKEEVFSKTPEPLLKPIRQKISSEKSI